MQPTWHGVSERFDVELAPPVLRLTQAIANSFSGGSGRHVDPLADLGSARDFVTQLAREWHHAHPDAPEVSDPGALTEADVRRLRALRNQVRATLHEDDERAGGLTARIEVVVSGRRIEASPSGRGSAWIESALAAELLLATQHDQLRRMKLCRNATCEVAFYDLSKNNSRVWHDMARCGTPQHVREYRNRKKAEQAR